MGRRIVGTTLPHPAAAAVIGAALHRIQSPLSGGKITLSGLTVGSCVWVRIATVPGGVVGAWSDPAKIIVT